MPKKLDEIDRNFASVREKLPDVIFRNVFDLPFSLHGFYKPHELKRFLRLPPEFETDERVNDGVRRLIHRTSGGRVRFVTDSDYVAIRAKLREPEALPHMASTGALGFDMYTRPVALNLEPAYSMEFVPRFEADGCSFTAVHRFNREQKLSREVCINFPLYAEVEELYVGLNEAACLEAPGPYTHQKPVVFYGSSITQGACAMRPGNCYTSILSRSLDFDMINLGFSGSAYGEQAIAEYIADIPMSAFVLDYDYNARSLDELINTHYAFYKTVRMKNPDLPIIMMSAPVAAPTRLVTPSKPLRSSRVVIMKSYIRAFDDGDKNVYFIDGESLLGDIEAKENLVDSVHPTDAGFKHMARRIYPVLKDVLYNTSNNTANIWQRGL